MQETLHCLIKLQKVDSQIFEIAKVRDTYPARVQEIQKKIEQQEVIQKARQEALDEKEKERSVKEQLLQSEEDKLKKWERRLAESKNHREIAPLAREIDAQKRLNEEAKEELDTLRKEEQQMREDLSSVDNALSLLQAELSKEETICKKETEGFDTQLATLEKDREQYTSKIRKAILRKYDTIKRRRDGLAVVPARNGCCTGCNMRLRPQLYNIIQKVQSLETCPSCNRILYWEEGLGHGTS
ncbi:MAG: hypothetical protein CL920_34720 [Deltaproteobacteria bacterium]|nr:hypothetical protein [Deltaproteobacteria bacterium]MBU53877.1 hypothetical protein [Deltaproteobacteria bacterium]